MPVTDTRPSSEFFIPKKQVEGEAFKKIKVNFSKYEHLRVTNNRLMVKMIPIDYSVSKGGISLGNHVKTTFLQGVVVKVGDGIIMPDKSVLPPNYQVGDVVYFSDASGADFKIFRDVGEYEDVRILDCDSIYYVDGTGSRLYDKVTED